MKLIVLPGNSKSNKEWSEKTAHVFSDLFTDQYLQTYSHWDEAKDIINLEIELKKLAEASNRNECIVIAKSAGAVLAIYGISKNLFKPKKCVFFGLPVLWAEENNFDLKSWFERYNIPTLIIQNSQDPITSCLEVRKFIEELSLADNVRIIEIDGNDHKYSDIEVVKKEIEYFLS